jgi:hypothetical protein
MFEPYGDYPKKSETHNDFDLLQEISRGDLYAGGERAEQWLNSYWCGARIIFYILLGAYFLGLLKEHFSPGAY